MDNQQLHTLYEQATMYCVNPPAYDTWVSHYMERKEELQRDFEAEFRKLTIRSKFTQEAT